MKFTFITVSAPALKSLMKAAKEIMSLEEGLLELRLYYAVTEYGKEKTDRLISDIKTSDMVFVDLMGSPVETVKAVYEGLRECNGNVIPYGNSAREYLKLGVESGWKAKDKAGEMAFVAKHGKGISRMLAYTVCRGYVSRHVGIGLTAWVLRNFVEWRYLTAMFRTFERLMGTKDFMRIIRSADRANPMTPRLSRARKES